mgnify:FL=1
MPEFKDYEINIIRRALSLLISNYDEYDLEELMYSGVELESEINLILEKLEDSHAVPNLDMGYGLS